VLETLQIILSEWSEMSGWSVRCVYKTTGIVLSGRGVVSRRIGCEIVIVIVMCVRPLAEMAWCYLWLW